MSTKKDTPEDIIVELLKAKDEAKIMKVARENNTFH